MSKKRLLIIFPDEWLSHSPTLLNLVDCLSGGFDIKLVTFDDGFFKNDHLCDDRFVFIKINIHLARFLLRKIRILYDIVKAMLLLIWLHKYWKRYKVNQVIAVDSIGLWTAQKFFTCSHFLSLEIKNDLFFRLSQKNKIDSLVIQSKERSTFLFKRPLRNVFLIPNSPVIDRKKSDNFHKRPFNGKIVFIGNINPNHGLYSCLNTVENYQQKFQDKGISITFKGIITKSSIRNRVLCRYRKLLRDKLVILDETYEPQNKIVEYLSNFSIGVCFYDFNFISKNNFNYISCPSGKMFDYFAAGVPVIGSDILGLKPVEVYNAGVLLKSITTKSIYMAIEEISSNFIEYRKNSLLAAEAYDFKKAVIPYKNFLSTINSII
jgi:glycosyltransferase involved in cell wall biosynthesis